MKLDNKTLAQMVKEGLDKGLDGGVHVNFIVIFWRWGMTCKECGMSVFENEYHPFAACLMFKACGSSRTVQANIRAIRDGAVEYCALSCDNDFPEAAKLIRELKKI